MKKVFFGTLVFSALALSSCEDHYDDPMHHHDVTVTFNVSDPTPGATYALGDTIFVNAIITGSSELHGIDAKLVNTGNGVIAKVYEDEDHKRTYHMYFHWVNDVTSHSDMRLEIIAATSHGGVDTEVHTVMFHAHPM